ncbi:hypothetical protein ATE68_01890 [Sphingopyxis sp. H038]|uniref:hypothetical protein n=1 Tax=unclassified Sphingopyxis TaxID=2614943 RepID=UPI0007302125|nr:MULTISPECIES: hypothetical protein [unclassified Sphingopyxis]KTE04420.1 hypothetical protein ATE78_01890 [Sphingopyxis sp. H012]KTE08143.1 hypothetical protein ATE76_16385 [Sphingopyxis sp. H093]KTE13379.1 hypothetical protein ATE70_01535 [Sphingopyxis sp. H053]KTE31218.1 hypothetical protein ATE75_01510 [Sphingopyxis sp. H080]KTE36910.1 hypothetical protein ATE68_01890 [Sphingopyxis sp. H038]
MKKEDVPEIPKEKEARKQIRILSVAQRQSLLKAAIEDQDGRAWLGEHVHDAISTLDISVPAEITPELHTPQP